MCEPATVLRCASRVKHPACVCLRLAGDVLRWWPVFDGVFRAHQHHGHFNAAERVGQRKHLSPDGRALDEECFGIWDEPPMELVREDQAWTPLDCVFPF